MIEITATELSPCGWPDCKTPINEGARIIYASTDSVPVHAWHVVADDG